MTSATWWRVVLRDPWGKQPETLARVPDYHLAHEIAADRARHARSGNSVTVEPE